VLGDLPVGWSLIGVNEPQGLTGGDVDRPLSFLFYATDQNPQGPIVAIVLENFASGQSGPVRHLQIDGRSAVLARSDFFAAPWLQVELEAGKWVTLQSQGMTDEALIEAGRHLQRDARGKPILSDPAALGLTASGSGSLFDFGNDSGALAATNSTYRSASGVEWNLSVRVRTDFIRTFAGMRGAEPVGAPNMYRIGRSRSLQTLYWERGDLAFELSSASGTDDSVGVDALVRTAKSVQRVRGTEWARLLSLPGSGGTPGITSPATATTEPVETTVDGHAGGGWTDVAVTTEVDRIDEFNYHLTFTTPDHTTSTADVELVGGALRCADSLEASLDGTSFSSGQGWVCRVASPSADRPVRARIYGVNHRRYLVDAQTINDVTFFVYHVDGIDSPNVDLVNQDGTIQPN
jgi:hypothetical protein